MLLCEECGAKGPAIQKIAHASKLTFNNKSAPDVDYIASLGSYGREEQNITQQLIQHYCKNTCSKLPTPYKMLLPVLAKDPTTSQSSPEMKEFLVFLPHDWISTVIASPDLQETVFAVSKVKEFWQAHDIARDEKMKFNPLSEKGLKPLYHMVPLLVHADGGKFQNNDSMMVISMRSILSSANVASSQLLLAGVPKTCMVKDDNPERDTMSCIWRLLVWSFTACYHGKHPAHDHLGHEWEDQTRKNLANTPLCQGWKACVFALGADLECFQNEYHLQCHSFAKCCWLCDANKSDIPYQDFRHTAKWRATVKDAAFNRNHPPTNHPIMMVPGVVTETFAIDSLHVNEEGTASNAIANVFFDLVIGKEWGGTQHQKLLRLNQEIVRQYEEPPGCAYYSLCLCVW